MKKTIILLIIFPLNIFSQNRFSGILRDSVNNQAIEFASIYINGTTIGTISDAAGYFYLQIYSYPCEIIVSHVSYKTKFISVNEPTIMSTVLTISPKDIYFPVVTIQDKNLREKNIELFKMCFLGNDYWGKNAILENDSVLYFKIEYYNQNTSDHKTDFNNEKTDKQSNELINLKYFQVISNYPLEVNLPLLGYHLHVDLVNFELNCLPKSHFCEYKYLCYFHYIPSEVNKREEKKITKNRLKAYYNSSMHFLRSLYTMTLKEDGYMVLDMETLFNKYFGSEEFDLYSYMKFPEQNIAEIVGLSGKKLNIFYSDNIARKSMNIKKGKDDDPIVSEIIFKNDTCTFRANGTLPSNPSILFKKSIAEKNVGASLPGDFIPEK